MSEEIRTNDLIDQELDRVIAGTDWTLKQTLIDEGIYMLILGKIRDIPDDRLAQPTSTYSRIAARDVDIVRAVVNREIQNELDSLKNRRAKIE